MPVSKEKATIGGYEYTPVKVFVQDISENKKDPVEEKNGYTFEYPFVISFATGTKKSPDMVQENRTSKVLSPKNWFKKFYVSNGNVRFTRDNDLLALVKVLLAKDQLKKEDLTKFDVNALIGVEFDAVVVKGENKETGNRYSFIDWIGTFVINGVYAPSLEQFDMVISETEKEESEHEEDNESDDAKVDPNDLPF